VVGGPSGPSAPSYAPSGSAASYAPPASQPAYAPSGSAPSYAPPVAQPAPAVPAPQPTLPAESAPAAAQAPLPTPQPFGVDDPLIAFVPGITQDAPPPRTAPDASAPTPPLSAAESAVPDVTQLRGEIPSAPPAPVPAAPPAAAFAPAATEAAVTPATEAPSAWTTPAEDPSDLEETRISIPGHRLVFTWDDGTRVSVSRRTVFGRNPGPEQGAVLVPVRDETLSLSKTHFEAAAEASGGWVMDRHSTNGTTVVRDGQRIACAPGEKVRIRLGDAIEIGDRIVTIGGYA
jgi:hypothetical protein